MVTPQKLTKKGLEMELEVLPNSSKVPDLQNTYNYRVKGVTQ